MLTQKFIRSAQRGDTIVEVLIALAILASAIGISYATANRSLIQARQAQEHSEALKIAESQLESLRELSTSTDPTKNIFVTGNGFCVDASFVVREFTPPNSPVTFTPAAAASADNLSNYPTACTTSFYRYGVVYTPASNSFMVSVRWPGVSSKGTDQVQLTYKLYRP